MDSSKSFIRDRGPGKTPQILPEILISPGKPPEIHSQIYQWIPPEMPTGTQ